MQLITEFNYRNIAVNFINFNVVRMIKIIKKNRIQGSIIHSQSLVRFAI